MATNQSQKDDVEIVENKKDETTTESNDGLGTEKSKGHQESKADELPTATGGGRKQNDGDAKDTNDDGTIDQTKDYFKSYGTTTRRGTATTAAASAQSGSNKMNDVTHQDEIKSPTSGTN